MKKYEIELAYSADVLQIYEYEALEDEENILERIEDGEFDIVEDSCFIRSVDELLIDGERVEGWSEKFEEIKIPQEGLCTTGGECCGRAYLTLELPEDEEFDVSKLIISGYSDVVYRMDKDHLFAAELENDEDDGIEDGDLFYYNGQKLDSEE